MQQRGARPHLLALDGAPLGPLHRHQGPLHVHRPHRRLVDQAWKRARSPPLPPRSPPSHPPGYPPRTVAALDVDDAAGADVPVQPGVHGAGGEDSERQARPTAADLNAARPACRGAYREAACRGTTIPSVLRARQGTTGGVVRKRRVGAWSARAQ